MLRFLRTPQLIVMATLQMSLFFLIYRYMFGGAIHVGGIPYVDFLVPGFVTTGVLFSGIGAAVAMAEDLEDGFVDRLRSLPIPRSAVLAARALADTAILALALGGHDRNCLRGRLPPRTARSPTALAALGLVVLFGFAFEWLFITMGLFAGTAQAAQGMGMIVFPFAFVSSAYVPVDSMPGWLQVVRRAPAADRRWSTPCGRSPSARTRRRSSAINRRTSCRGRCSGRPRFSSSPSRLRLPATVAGDRPTGGRPTPCRSRPAAICASPAWGVAGPAARRPADPRHEREAARRPCFSTCRNACRSPPSGPVERTS